MLKAERISCSDPKLSDAQTRNFEAIKHNWFSARASNGFLEGMNSVIQSLKRASRGFRNVGYFTTMIFLRHGRLDFSAQLASGCATH